MNSQLLIAGSGVAVGLAAAFLSIGVGILAQISKPKRRHAWIFLGLAVVWIFLFIFLWNLATRSQTIPEVPSVLPPVDTGTLPYWLSGIGTISAVLVTLAIAVWIPRWRKPRFGFEFANEEPYCRTAPLMQQQNVNSYWVRLKIINSGKSPSSNCVGKLTAIMDNGGQRLRNYDPVMLHWVGTDWAATPFRPIDLNQGDYEFLDITYVSAGEPSMALICQDRQPRGIPNYLSPGIYRLQITIYSANANPATKEYRLVFGGTTYTDIRLEETT